MKKKITLGLLSLTILIVMILTTAFTIQLFYAREGIIKEEFIPIYFAVDNFGGMTTDTDALRFGTITPGGAGMRPIVLNNTYSFPVSVEVRFTGDAGEYVWMSPQESILQPGDSKKVEMHLTVPNYFAYGNYTGTAHFIFKRVQE